jgi:hypothetical protein
MSEDVDIEASEDVVARLAAWLISRVLTAVEASPPDGVTQGQVQSFRRRRAPELVLSTEAQLQPYRAKIVAKMGGKASSARGAALEPELWSAAKRTSANIAAMELAASKPPASMTNSDLQVLGRYSGWGGLSLTKAAGRFPKGFPAPEERGLIHEFYTPTAVVREIARVLGPVRDGLPRHAGQLHVLEPAAGIGRFVAGMSEVGDKDMAWHVIEYSKLSARMLSAMRPDIDVFEGPFEEWTRDKAPAVAGKLGLVLSNPPYGQRGASVAIDRDRKYREKNAYAYFLRRSLDMLAAGGMGVFLVPAGFLTGTSERAQKLRAKVLTRHHLATAYRLPSKLFPGANLVTDLLFFRARGGELDAVDESDTFIVEGRYFERYPRNILGTESGKDRGGDDQTKKPRWGYEVLGTFDKLPDLAERPVCGACVLRDVMVFPGAEGRKRAARGGTARTIDRAAQGLTGPEAQAAGLGLRVDRFLALVASGKEAAHTMWGELVSDLGEWRLANGNPWAMLSLRRLADKERNEAVQRFLAAWTKGGLLIPGMLKAPVIAQRYTGRQGDIIELAEWEYRQRRGLTIDALLTAYEAHSGLSGSEAIQQVTGKISELLDAGWYLDGDTWQSLVPKRDYLSGLLWPRVDRARALLAGEVPRAGGRPVLRDGKLFGFIPLERIKVQLRALLDTIAPVTIDDIDGVAPNQGWIPLDLIGEWLGQSANRHYNGGKPVKLQRLDGLVLPATVKQVDDINSADISAEVVWCLGWMNHDRTVFKPRKSRREDNIDDIRLKWAKKWSQDFRAFIAMDEARRARLEEQYNRTFRGLIAPDYSSEPLDVARWTTDGIELHPHQASGGRRLLANRGGLLAFDVGVGKTYTGIGVLARARQEGWARRPVILVPNSIVWKWEADIKRVLPDYRVVVIGSNLSTIKRGPEKGSLTSTTDSAEDRGRKWAGFQAGEYDVAILSYSSMPRTKMNEETLRKYSEKTAAIKREIALRARNARKAGSKVTERQAAIAAEGVAAWLAEVLELPKGWDYDPGVAWDDLGVDMLIVDEAQNFKNLYLPEPREHGVPRFMGNAGSGAKRAWHLDFRCELVRQQTGGTGVILLSATPAKNSPLEFYNLLQYIDHNVWSQLGIHDPEQFIDRYCLLEQKLVINSAMEAVSRSAVTGFINLHELRDVIFRLGEFKTAEDVGLVLPEPTVHLVQVDMDPAQDAKYEKYVAEIQDAMEDREKRSQILGLLARMALVAVHAELDEGYKWKTAADAVADGSVNPTSPKFAALAERVMANRTCGHIVFCDNIAAHQWIIATLVKAGVPRDRIGVLNAVVAKATAKRQAIARDFNGDASVGHLPRYDVVIANAIAYEGIDLQTRTCAIHHLDLPWEPATLQQRNGRGVRQGNTLAAIEINYYFAKSSQDGMRFNLIQGKLGWMNALIKGQDRSTNNPAAQLDMGPEEILLLISRDPEQTALRLAELRVKREAEARQRVASAAAGQLRAANGRFRRAKNHTDSVEAARLREEGEARLRDLAKVDVDAWPWAKWLGKARDHVLVVPDPGGAPLWEGLRFGLADEHQADVWNLGEIGKVMPGRLAWRKPGSFAWAKVSLAEGARWGIKPAGMETDEWEGWAGDNEAVDALFTRNIASQYGWTDQSTMEDANWHLASDAWLTGMWQRNGDALIKHFAEVASYYAAKQQVPLVVSGVLEVARGPRLVAAGAVALPPTRVGFATFLKLGPASGLKWGDLDQAAKGWWGLSIPRDLLSKARK